MIIRHKDRGLITNAFSNDFNLSIDDGHRSCFSLSFDEAHSLAEELLHFIHDAKAGRPTLNSFPNTKTNDSPNSGWGRDFNPPPKQAGRELSSTCECPHCRPNVHNKAFRPNEVFFENWPDPRTSK